MVKCHVLVSIDKGGRVVIPKPTRDALNLEPGDKLEMEIVDGQITLRPARHTPRLVKEHGVWVIYTGEPITAMEADDLLRQVRSERDMANLGTSE